MEICRTLHDARMVARFARSVRLSARIVKVQSGYAVLWRA